MKNSLLALVVLCGFHSLPPAAHAEAVAVFSDAGPDADAYGKAEGYQPNKPGVKGSQKTLVGTYSHFDELHASHLIPAAPQPSKLPRAAQELQLTYTYLGKTETLDSYLARNPATGLLIMSGHEIAFEHYQYSRTDHDHFTSQSMAKTIVALALGVAVADGRVHSVADMVAEYVPELAGTEAGKTPLSALLHMSSGLQFHEVYDGKDDIADLNRLLMKTSSPEEASVLRKFNTRAAAPGTVFNYSGLDTELLSLVVANATHTPIASLVADRIWKPIGAEAAASWSVDGSGKALAYCCFNAVLRDYGRLGALLANDGEWEGKQIISRQWMLDATTVSSPQLAPGGEGRRYGYGYQVWLLPGDRRQFALRGIHGQTIMIDPASKTVLVHTAVRPNAVKNGGEAELEVLWAALVAKLDHQ